MHYCLIWSTGDCYEMDTYFGNGHYFNCSSMGFLRTSRRLYYLRLMRIPLSKINDDDLITPNSETSIVERLYGPLVLNMLQL